MRKFHEYSVSEDRAPHCHLISWVNKVRATVLNRSTVEPYTILGVKPSVGIEIFHICLHQLKNQRAILLPLKVQVMPLHMTRPLSKRTGPGHCIDGRCICQAIAFGKLQVSCESCPLGHCALLTEVQLKSNYEQLSTSTIIHCYEASRVPSMHASSVLQYRSPMF